MEYLELVFSRPFAGSLSYLSIDDSPAFGRRVYAMLGRKKLTAYVIAESSSPPDLPAHIRCRPIEGFIDEEAVFNQDLIALARWMSQAYMCSLGEALAAMIPKGKRSRAFSVLMNTTEEIFPRPEQLSVEQAKAVTAITSQRQGNFYLYGITGSGKTEVFLRAAEQTLAEKRGVIYLLPEIALAHQLVDIIHHRFQTQSAVLHSGLSASQRIAEWRKILKGEAQFVIGVRTAIFAPLESIGLIIIDEEHESSYKSDATPRYHARQVAMFRAGKHTARLVMGSATPSVEAWHHTQKGTFYGLRLNRRLAAGALPQLEVVNMRGSRRSLSDKLIAEMRQTLEEGRQILLFLNRRGFGYFYHCRSCGADFSCIRCSVSLTYHKDRQRLICHHCGYQNTAPQSCSECGSLDLGYSGFGTEKVEEDVQSCFPSFKLARLDADSTKTKGVLESRLWEFRQGSIDILIGTQMVAKGLNFPGVALVGIILADSSLHLPDFRSFEKTFALITQVAGRAGRYRADGRVILQTFSPEHHIIRQAAAQDVDGFYARELIQRRELKFPPFNRFLRILVRGKNEDRVWALAQQLAEKVRSLLSSLPAAELLGPAESPIALINTNYRVHMLILAAKIGHLQSAIPAILQSTKPPAGFYVEIDVDPQSML